MKKNKVENRFFKGFLPEVERVLYFKETCQLVFFFQGPAARHGYVTTAGVISSVNCSLLF